MKNVTVVVTQPVLEASQGGLVRQFPGRLVAEPKSDRVRSIGGNPTPDRQRAVPDWPGVSPIPPAMDVGAVGEMDPVGEFRPWRPA